MTICPVVSDSRGRYSSPFPTHRASVCLKTTLRGHVASVTRHRTPLTFPPRWYLFIYSQFCILHAFEPLGWWGLRQVTRAHSVTWIQSYDCRSSDLAAQRLQWFNPQCHHVPSYLELSNQSSHKKSSIVTCALAEILVSCLRVDPLNQWEFGVSTPL